MRTRLMRTGWSRWLWGLGPLVLMLEGTGCTGQETGCWFEETSEPLAPLLCDWQRHPQNPLLTPPGNEWLIADPTLLRPDESPDGRWHLFANALFGWV